MPNSLAKKLQRFVTLSADERAALAGFATEVTLHEGGTDLILQGDQPSRVHLLVEGWGCRYKLLPDGRRQIVAYLVPGDLCDVQVFVLRRMDHSIGVLGDAKVALISPGRMLDAMERHPRIARALWWATLVDEATLREWIVNIGRRAPYERIAHLLCELWVRLDNVGLTEGGRFKLPLTQSEIGDTVALTPVTVNRVLQRLRRAGLITFHDGELTILDAEQLATLSGFDPIYLHGERERDVPHALPGIEIRAGGRVAT